MNPVDIMFLSIIIMLSVGLLIDFEVLTKIKELVELYIISSK